MFVNIEKFTSEALQFQMLAVRALHTGNLVPQDLSFFQLAKWFTSTAEWTGQMEPYVISYTYTYI